MSQRLINPVTRDGLWLSGEEILCPNSSTTLFATLSKPRVLDVYEWEEWRQQLPS